MRSSELRDGKVVTARVSQDREAVGSVDERVKQAGLLYEQAVHAGDAAPLARADRELDAAEADLAVARGRVMHARFLLRRDLDLAAAEEDTADEDTAELALFERAARLYRTLGDLRGEAEALFWVGCLHQVIRHDDGTAVPVLERSLDLASRSGDPDTMAEALRHLGIAAHRAGHLDEARGRLEEATRLRQQTGQLPSAAANMIGLAYIATAQDRRSDAQALLDEAAAIAAASDAHRILAQVTEARAEFSGQHPHRTA
ncbi:MAG: tetratricopeptide repeat protein [Trebonia sp.]|jgi:tetratricopeptide (TPR) repeat protein